MRCPIDQTELRIAERQGIEIDYCPQCRGVWLDRGELDKLIERQAMMTPEPPVQGGYGRDEERRRYGSEPAAPYPAPRPYHDDDDDDDRRRYGHKKRRGWLGEIFDLD